MSQSIYPILYQLPARIWLEELGAGQGRCASLDEAPEAMLDELAARGFEWLWLMGVWQTGDEGRRVSATTLEGRGGVPGGGAPFFVGGGLGALLSRRGGVGCLGF